MRRTGRTRLIVNLVAGAFALAAGGVWLVVQPAGAQQAPTTTNALQAIAAAAASSTTRPPPSEVLPSTTTIPLSNCTPIRAPYVVFVGRITAYQVPTFRFQVQKVVSGRWDGPLIDVQFKEDAGYLRLGPSYLVAAQVDETGKLYSKLRTSFSTLPKPGTCPGDDPIITKMSDGTPVNTSMLVGMKGKWRKVAVAFFVPTVAVFGVLIIFVSLKHLLSRVLKVSPVSSRRRPYAE